MAEPGGDVQQPEELMKQLHLFVKTSTLDKKTSNEEVVQSGLFLLRNLPSARSAVLDHLCLVFDNAVNTHVVKLDTDNNSTEVSVPEDDPMISAVHDVLMTLVHSHPEVWAPVISAWSIELLGHISSKYAGRRAVPHSNNLNEVLQLWMTCQPTKTLIEVASECFASMVGNTPDVSVDALLQASAKHSAHFDWVVAHIGSCFPRTIITRVLKSSFKDFKESAPETWTGPEDRNSKMSSAVGILGHLAAQHGREIKEALVSLFEESLKLSRVKGNTENQPDLKVAPFLLCLAEKSPMLLRTLTSNLVQVMTPHVLNRLADQLTRDQGKSIPNKDNLLNLIVHLITQSREDALKVFKFLVEIGAPSVDADAMEVEETLRPIVQSLCAVILNRFITDIQRVVNARCNDTALEIPFLLALKPHAVYLSKLTVQGSEGAILWYSQLLTCLALYTDQSTSAEILTSLAIYCNVKQLSIFVQVLQAVTPKYNTILENVLQRALGMLENVSKEDEIRLNLLKNLVQLVKWNISSSMGMISFNERLQCHLEDLGSILETGDESVACIIMQIFKDVGLSSSVAVRTQFKLCAITVQTLFNTMWISDIQTKLRSCDTCIQYLSSLCDISPSAQTAIIRYILECTLSNPIGALFGSKQEAVKPGTSDLKTDQNEPILLAENRKPRVGPKPGIFHAGIIGQGLKRPPQPSKVPLEQQADNKRIMLQAMHVSCGERHGNAMLVEETLITEESTDEGVDRLSLPVSSTISSLLVNLITSDVMFNKMDWPDEEFFKFTIERDLVIKKRFEEFPVLWELMDYLARGEGAMWVCAPILRGLLGTLIAHWEACRDKSAKNSPWHLQASCSIIQWMRQGGLLAPPLAYLDEILHLLSPNEVYLILLNVWRYMYKEKPPLAPSQRAMRKSQPCDWDHMIKILPILHKNIDKLGHLYARFYVPEHAEKYQKLASSTFTSIPVE